MAGENFFCSKCGSELSKGAVFCTNCGTQIPSSNENPSSSVNYGNMNYAAPKGSSKTAIIIIICVTVVILGILGTVLAIVLSKNGDSSEKQASGLDSNRLSNNSNNNSSNNNNSNNSGNNNNANNNMGNNLISQDQTSDSQNTIGGNNSGGISESTSTISYPALSSGQAIVTLTEKATGKQTETGSVATYYTVGNGYDIFCVMLTYNASNIMLISGAVKSGNCNSGSNYQASNLKSDNAFIDLVYLGINEDGTYSDKSYEHTSYLNPDDIKNCTFDIGSYSAKNSSTYYIKTDFTFDGIDYTLEAFCCADYTASAENIQQSQIDQYQNEINNGICTVCHGSGICQVCYGLGGVSYNTYGQGGSGWVECEGCHGNRKCKYCGGTGKA